MGAGRQIEGRCRERKGRRAVGVVMMKDSIVAVETGRRLGERGRCEGDEGGRRGRWQRRLRGISRRRTPSWEVAQLNFLIFASQNF